MIRRFSVTPNSVGFLFHRNQLVRQVEPGIYYFFDPLRLKFIYPIAMYPIAFPVENQEVLSKDLVAYRFSYTVQYVVSDPQKLIRMIDLTQLSRVALQTLSSAIHVESQRVLRDRLAQLTSQEVNERRAEVFAGVETDVQAAVVSYGAQIQKITLRDLTFPKRIQDLFALELESRIRAKADLENARTSVAAARALKNAADILKDDGNVKFMQYLEAMTKIAASGKHTFVIGERPFGGETRT